MHLRLAALVIVFAACGTKPTGGDGSGGSSESGADTGSDTSGGTGTASSTGAVDPTSGGVATDPGPGACPDPNSTYMQGDCFCNAGYEWCNPDDPGDLTCCVIETSSSADPTGGSSSATATTSVEETGTTDATTGDPGACAVPPPDGCDPGMGTRWCDSGPGCPLEGSTLYSCSEGMWVPSDGIDMSCINMGHDFAFGCVDSGGMVEVVCGDGPGTACEADQPGFCTDVAVLQSCQHGKLADTDCVAACTSGAVDGIMHDSGFCMMSRQSSNCECCDAPNCP